MKKHINRLRKAYKKEKDAKILKRILMVLYTLKKETIRDVGKRLNCSHPTVLYWKCRYEKEGLEGLKTKPKSGKPRKISRRQEANLKKIIGNKPEKAWTTKQVSSLIEKKTRILYSTRQAARILHRWTFHLTTGRPMYWHKASEEEIAKFGKKNLLLQK